MYHIYIYIYIYMKRLTRGDIRVLCDISKTLLRDLHYVF